MLIKSHIQPDHLAEHKTRLVEMGPNLERPYHFAKTSDGAYVADVNDDEDLDTLLATGHFSIYKGEDSKPKLGLRRSAALSDLQPAAPEFTPSEQDEAIELLKSDPAQIGTAIGTVSSVGVLKAAVVLEEGNKKPRAAVLSQLKLAIEGLAQAG